MIRNNIIFVFCFILFNCSPREDPQDEFIKLSETELEISFEEDFQIHAEFERVGYTSADLEWESEAENIAEVDQNGLVTAKREGKTTITARTSDRLFSTFCEVAVYPTNFLYKEPYFDFGTDQAFILKKEDRHLAIQIPDAMVFNGENQDIRYLNYRFKDKKYYESFVVLAGGGDIQVRILDFLRQRYDLLGSSLNRFYFGNEYRSVIWGPDENQDMVIMYFPKGN